MASSMINLCIFFIFSFIVYYILYIILHNNTKNSYDHSIKILYRQCARWAVASLQDNAEIIQVLHANYAAGYLWALKDIVSTSDFYKLTGQDFLQFEKTIVYIQNQATKRIVDKCQDLVFINNPILFNAMYI